MDPTAISQFISSVGFPITCTAAMFYMFNKIEDRHKEEVDKLTEALNNNTIALTEIKTMLKEGRDENES